MPPHWVAFIQQMSGSGAKDIVQRAPISTTLAAEHQLASPGSRSAPHKPQSVASPDSHDERLRFAEFLLHAIGGQQLVHVPEDRVRETAHRLTELYRGSVDEGAEHHETGSVRRLVETNRTAVQSALAALGPPATVTHSPRAVKAIAAKDTTMHDTAAAEVLAATAVDPELDPFSDDDALGWE